jgi:hypothetical protein
MQKARIFLAFLFLKMTSELLKIVRIMCFRQTGNAMSSAKVIPLALAALLQACIYLPKTREIYDADCQITYRHMVLEHSEVHSLGTCHNTDCVGTLIAAGAVTAASAVISGSIVVVGNTAYWLEKQGRCTPVSTSGSGASSSAPVPGQLDERGIGYPSP